MNEKSQLIKRKKGKATLAWDIKHWSTVKLMDVYRSLYKAIHVTGYYNNRDLIISTTKQLHLPRRLVTHNV